MNAIVALKKGDKWLVNPKWVKEEITKYFGDHFSEVMWDRPTMDGITFPSLLVEDVVQLQRPFEDVEIKDIIDSSQNNKSPGPDGFNSEFFRRCWE
ncbi:transposon TX1 putative 149 kDa protein, partial [Trifolium medium]|nr:transposon TX1 putative 149 kDa protein [Trifolium medium]